VTKLTWDNAACQPKQLKSTKSRTSRSARRRARQDLFECDRHRASNSKVTPQRGDCRQLTALWCSRLLRRKRAGYTAHKASMRTRFALPACGPLRAARSPKPGRLSSLARSYHIHMKRQILARTSRIQETRIRHDDKKGRQNRLLYKNITPLRLGWH